MCGIVGVFKKARSGVISQHVIEAMTDAIAHRGPDDCGFFGDDYVGMGHRRLAILDLSSAGHQPMRERESSKVLIFNGEIYNYQIIRDRLSSLGETFRTNCDTEVLLRLADVESSTWIHEMLGMFAFAVWDPDKKKLMLCRDRLGIKPLYYIDLPDALVYASEIKALLCYPGVTARLNTKKVAEFIAFRNISGRETLFDDIHELEPGSVLTISAAENRPSIRRYWDAAQHCEEGLPTDGSVEGFESLFEECVKSRLISDVPLGTFNSGGVDSSLTSLFVRKNKPDLLHTFSVGFHESAYDESGYAEFVAQRLDTTHHKFLMDQRTYLNTFDKTLTALEEPLNHPHTVPLYLLCKEARKHVTVVLTGEGADELFGGYPRYQIAQFAHAVTMLPGFLRGAGTYLAGYFNLRRLTKLLEISGNPVTASLECSRFTPLQDLGRVFEDGVDWLGERHHIYARHDDERNFLERLLAYERDTYLQSLLIRLDKMSMASALEARVPFLDHRLVCWSRLLPPRNKIRLFRQNKVMVKKCAARYFPDDFVHRKKVGFGVPIGEWLRDKRLMGGLLDHLLDASFRRRYPFSFPAVEKMIADHRDGTANHVEVLWGILSFELWCRQFLDGCSVSN